jgi:hypothetical protein
VKLYYIFNLLNNIQMKTFNDLEFKDMAEHYQIVQPGIQATIKFDNGYGASVVRHNFSYGHEEGLYELAVLDSNDKITYDTLVTEDVLGHLSEEDVTNALKQIQEL